jgi:hypothetical protein
MPKPSIGAEILRQIREHKDHVDTVAYLRAMVGSAPPTTESEYLDFKGWSNPKGNLSEKEEGKIWSEALSSFGTTSGGVLVWGLDARKNANDIDEVMGLALVADPNRLKSRLHELLPRAVDPPVLGVEIYAYPDANDSGKGFVVCFVPESQYKPHRTEIGGRRWMMRVGDSFVDVPPPVLRSLFFPQRQSYITAEMRPVNVGSATGGRDYAYEWFLILANHGPASAHHLCVVSKEQENLQYAGATLNFKTTLPHHNAKTSKGQQFRFLDSIHVGEVIEFKSLPLTIPSSFTDGHSMSPDFKLEFEFEIYADDQLPQVVKIGFTPYQVRRQEQLEGKPGPMEIGRFGDKQE